MMIVIGGAMAGLWAVLLVQGEVPEIAAGEREIWFHLAAELLTAVALVAGAAALLRGSGLGARIGAAFALGALAYSTIASAGYYADAGQGGVVAAFFVLAALSGIAALAVATDGPVVNRVLRRVLTSRAHRLMSGSLVVLAVRGRRTRREITFPVQFARRGEVLVVTPGQATSKSWWRNLEGGAPPALRRRALAPGGRPRTARRPRRRRLRGGCRGPLPRGRFPRSGRHLGIDARVAAPLVEVTLTPSRASAFAGRSATAVPNLASPWRR